MPLHYVPPPISLEDATALAGGVDERGGCRDVSHVRSELSHADPTPALRWHLVLATAAVVLHVGGAVRARPEEKVGPKLQIRYLVVTKHVTTPATCSDGATSLIT